jgi:hypothetical protein
MFPGPDMDEPNDDELPDPAGPENESRNEDAK